MIIAKNVQTFITTTSLEHLSQLPKELKFSLLIKELLKKTKKAGLSQLFCVFTTELTMLSMIISKI